MYAIFWKFEIPRDSYSALQYVQYVKGIERLEELELKARSSFSVRAGRIIESNPQNQLGQIDVIQYYCTKMSARSQPSSYFAPSKQQFELL